MQAADWQQLIDSKKMIMGDEVHQLITSQYQAFAHNQAPKIADPVIKNIPIIESHEPLIDINQANSCRITMLPNPSHPFASPDCNSGFPAASKIRKTVWNNLLYLRFYLDILARDFGYEPRQISIHVFEGLRSLKTQTSLFENKRCEIRNANPLMTHEEVFSETCKWVSPVVNNIPVHSTGAAIDIRLWDNYRKQFIDMGPFGVIWGKNTTAPTFSDDLTDEQKINRLYLLIAAAKVGLVNYLYEFWHYSCGDRYASYWLDPQDKRKAIYGAVEE
jgi:D-alanyl-D-alanine dipeptidase